MLKTMENNGYLNKLTIVGIIVYIPDKSNTILSTI